MSKLVTCLEHPLRNTSAFLLHAVVMYVFILYRPTRNAWKIRIGMHGKLLASVGGYLWHSIRLHMSDEYAARPGIIDNIIIQSGLRQGDLLVGYGYTSYV